MLEYIVTYTLVGAGGGLECKSVGKADLLSDHFNSNQFRKSVDLLSLAIRLLVLSSFPSGRVRFGISC